MATKKLITTIGALILVILTYSFYITLPGEVKIEFHETKTVFNVFEDTKFELAATERIRLFDGTKLMRASSRDIFNTSKEGLTIANRVANFKDGIISNDYYIFNNSIIDVENVPVKEVHCFENAKGKIFEYHLSDILYTGASLPITSPFSFGHRMTIEWQDGAYSAKVVQNIVASDKVKIRYRITEDYQCFDVRLFDPVWNDTKGSVTLQNVTFNYCGNVSAVTFYPNLTSATIGITKTAEQFNTTAVYTDYTYNCTGAPINCFSGNDSNWSSKIEFNDSFSNQYVDINYTFVNNTKSAILIYKMNNSNCTIQCFNYTQTNVSNGTYTNITGLTCDATNQSVNVPYECLGGLSQVYAFRFGGNNSMLFEQILNYTIYNHTNASFSFTFTDYNASLVNQTSLCAINVSNNHTLQNVSVWLYVNETFSTNPFYCGINKSTSITVNQTQRNIFNLTNQTENYIKCWGSFINATETKYHQVLINASII